jgi:hypothetical protein
MEASTTAADANRSNSGGTQAMAVGFDLDLDGLSVPHTRNILNEALTGLRKTDSKFGVLDKT